MTGLYGMSLGGHTNIVTQTTTSAAGFAVEDVKVSGNLQTSEIEVFQLLGLDGSTSLIALDIDAARRKLVQLPWVEDVDIRKVYPKTVEVRLKERQAFGIWQHGTERVLPVSSSSWPTGRKSATVSALMSALPAVAGICISITASSSSCRKKTCRRRCNCWRGSISRKRCCRAMSPPSISGLRTAPRSS